MSSRSALIISALSLFLSAACGGSDDGGIGSGGSAGSASGGAAGIASGGSAGIGSGGVAGGAGTPTGGAAGSASGGNTSTVLDPRTPGPFSTASVEGSAKVSATGNSVPIRCAVPATGPVAAPYPVVLILHGFQLPATQYQGYADRLASFGYVACTADYPATLLNVNHANAAKDTSGALDWVIESSTTVGGSLAGKVDETKVGVMGHSLGGKVSVLAAAGDARFKAVLGLDPVDTVPPGCGAAACPDASQKLPLPIPSAFLGETLDATGSFQACAPQADNYQTFFSAAASPSLEITLNGASHMSFVDDLTTCGFACGLCKPASMPQADALGIARAYTVAFFERYLRGVPGYDSWLTGSEATAAFVTTGQVTLQSK